MWVCLSRCCSWSGNALCCFCWIRFSPKLSPNCESASSDFNQTASSFLSPSGKQCRHQHILGETLIWNIQPRRCKSLCQYGRISTAPPPKKHKNPPYVRCIEASHGRLCHTSVVVVVVPVCVFSCVCSGRVLGGGKCEAAAVCAFSTAEADKHKNMNICLHVRQIHGVMLIWSLSRCPGSNSDNLLVYVGRNQFLHPLNSSSGVWVSVCVNSLHHKGLLFYWSCTWRCKLQANAQRPGKYSLEIEDLGDN